MMFMFEGYFFDYIKIMTLIPPSDNNSCKLGVQLLVPNLPSSEIETKWHPTTIHLPLLVRANELFALIQDIRIEICYVEFRYKLV